LDDSKQPNSGDGNVTTHQKLLEGKEATPPLADSRASPAAPLMAARPALAMTGAPVTLLPTMWLKLVAPVIGDTFASSPPAIAIANVGHNSPTPNERSAIPFSAR